MNERQTLSFDGVGINGPDEYRSRLATFTSDEAARRWGPLFEAAPELLEACEEALPYLEYLASNGSGNQDAEHTADMLTAAIAKATQSTERAPA